MSVNLASAPYRRNRRSLSEGNILILDDDKRMQFNLRDHADSDDEATGSSSMRKRLQSPLRGQTRAKFISSAEVIYKFHTETPKRYRSQSKLTRFQSNPSLAPLKLTLPQSPVLRTKIRTPRPCNYISKEQQEQMEFEEKQKLQFKAKPVNKNPHGPSKSVPIKRKPLTKLEPFKLTCPPSKKPSTDNNTYSQFKAREATVLKKKPFMPSLPDKRVEREEFERKMKLREAEVKQQRQHIKEMQAEKEQKERAKCRKLALSKKVTDPVTPLLHQKKSGKGG